jgi:hypothetical protein
MKLRKHQKKEGVHYDCIDTKYDSHCGGSVCEKCEDNKVCTDSVCVSECMDGFLNCNGVCLDKSKYKVTSDGENSCKCRSGYCPINGDPNKGCPDELNSDNHCGECGKKCPVTMTCTPAGVCICQVDYYDSCIFDVDSYNHNTEIDNLCIQYKIKDSDTNPLADLHIVREKNCSAPGSQGYPCENDGTKVCHKCAEHYANLDGDWSNGCETDLSVNVTNCGSIGNNCYEKLNKAAGIACVDNRCVYTVCNEAGYLDCNNDSNAETTPDGCEANIKTDANHCGRCGNLCLSNKCVDGVCCYSDNLNITQDLVQFTCCSGNQLYRYAHQPVVCPEPSHYGCASAKPEGDCWSAK